MSRPIFVNQDFQNASRIMNLPAPAAPTDAARLVDVTTAIEGLGWKDNARVSTQSNINLSSPGATVDGVTMVTGDRVLVRAQTTGSQNGIYVWNGSAVAMARAADASTAVELESAVVGIDEGTDAGVTFRQSAVNFTIDSGTVTWASFGTGAATATETTAGIAEIATQSETNTGTDDNRFVTPLKLATWSGRIKKTSSLIGDGSATQFDVTHNFNTTACTIAVFEESTGIEVECDMKRQSVNVARLNFTVAPTSNQFRVVIIA